MAGLSELSLNFMNIPQIHTHDTHDTIARIASDEPRRRTTPQCDCACCVTALILADYASLLHPVDPVNPVKDLLLRRRPATTGRGSYSSPAVFLGYVANS